MRRLQPRFCQEGESLAPPSLNEQLHRPLITRDRARIPYPVEREAELNRCSPGFEAVGLLLSSYNLLTLYNASGRS